MFSRATCTVAALCCLFFSFARTQTTSDPFFPEKMSRYGEYDVDAGVWISAPCSGDWINPETGLFETRGFEWKNYV